MFEKILQFQARVHPGKPAVVAPGRRATYLEFHEDIERGAAQLRPMARPGMTVAVATRGYYQHLVAANAAARLGLIVCSVVQAGKQDLLDLIRPDLVLTDVAAQEFPGKVVDITAWKSAPVPSEPVEPLGPYEPSDPVQILVTSGTTGTRKLILITREMFDQRLLLFTALRRLGPDARLLSMMGLDVAGGLITPFQAWIVGGAILNGTEWLLDRALGPRDRPTSLQASAGQLGALMSRLPPGEPLAPGMTVFTGGTVVSADLVARLNERLTRRIYILYGSTEAGPICCVQASHVTDREGAAGYPDPWAEVRVVGPNGKDLPRGEVGDLLVRTPHMPTAYIGDKAQTAITFKGGWFRPGDVGVIDDDGLLRILGRVDEVLNFGGVKLTLSSLEQTAASCAGVIDAGACVIERSNGRRQPFVVVQAGPGFDRKALKQRLAERFGKGEIGCVTMDRIPRNPSGKIQRSELAELVQQAPDRDD